MTNFIDAIWGNVKLAAEAMQRDNNKVYLNEEKRKEFEDLYCHNESIVKKYMFNPAEHLDRHKVAAIVIVSLIKARVLDYTNGENGEIFVGNYVLSTEVGLSYMREELNDILKELLEPVIDKYFFPDSWTCDNNYFRVFYRNLYFADENNEWGLNPLDIAEKLFLLEYITLKKQGINVNKLREYERAAR